VATNSTTTANKKVTEVTSAAPINNASEGTEESQLTKIHAGPYGSKGGISL